VHQEIRALRGIRDVGAGFAGFAVTRRSTFAGVACGEIVMLVGKWWLG
jgi:hypothetical protein